MAEEIDYREVIDTVLKGTVDEIREKTRFKNIEMVKVGEGVKKIIPKPSILGEKAKTVEDVMGWLHEATVSCSSEKCMVEGHFSVPPDRGEHLASEINKIEKCVAGIAAEPFPPRETYVLNVTFTCDAPSPVDAGRQVYDAVKKLEKEEDMEKRLREELEGKYGREYASVVRLKMIRKALRRLGF